MCASMRSTGCSPRSCALCSISWPSSALPFSSVALADRAWELVADNLAGWNRSNTPLRVPLALSAAAVVLRLCAFPFSLWRLPWCRALLALMHGDYAKVAPDRRRPFPGRGGQGGARRPRHQAPSKAKEKSLTHARHCPLPADRAARHQRSRRRRHGRARLGAQPVLLVDAALSRHGRHHLELAARNTSSSPFRCSSCWARCCCARASPCASTTPSPSGSPGCRAG